jgi:hypothetical protein
MPGPEDVGWPDGQVCHEKGPPGGRGDQDHNLIAMEVKVGSLCDELDTANRADPAAG